MSGSFKVFLCMFCFMNICTGDGRQQKEQPRKVLNWKWWNLTFWTKCFPEKTLGSIRIYLLLYLLFWQSGKKISLFYVIFSFQNIIPINSEIFSDHVNIRPFIPENCLSLSEGTDSNTIFETFIHHLSQNGERHTFGPGPWSSSDKSLFSEQLSYINGQNCTKYQHRVA